MKRILSASLIILLLIYFNSCKKDKTNSVATGKVQFSLKAKTNTKLKAALEEVTASNILVSIETAEGKVVNESEKIELYNFNGTYISKPLSLNPGSVSS